MIKSNLFFLCAQSGFACSEGGACRGLTPILSDQISWCEMAADISAPGLRAEALRTTPQFKMTATAGRGPRHCAGHFDPKRAASRELCLPDEIPAKQPHPPPVGRACALELELAQLPCFNLRIKLSFVSEPNLVSFWHKPHQPEGPVLEGQ